MRNELNDQNQLGPLYNYDDGKCAEDSTRGRAGPRPCFATFSLPTNTKPGVYQIIWWWKFDKDPRGLGEEYTSCFDVEVLNQDGSSSLKNTTGMMDEMENSNTKSIKIREMMREYHRRVKVYNRQQGRR